jgi:hypothetical protein
VTHGKDLCSSASVELASVDNKGEQDTVQYNGTSQSKSKSQKLCNSKSSGTLEFLASWQIVISEIYLLYQDIQSSDAALQWH